MAKDFSSQVSGVIRDFGMIPEGAAVLAGVSGGPDSIALARVLISLAPSLGFSPGIAHLNHGLRGEESDRDEAFTRKFAQQFALPCFIEQADIAARAKAAGASLEEAGRNARYGFFTRVARANGYDCIALGHNADDNAEQVLMGLIRGAGTKGLSGIPPIRDGRIIRPLIHCSRAQILSFLDSLGQPYVLDSSNQDPQFLRNRVRQELIPFLEKGYNPNIRKGLNRLSTILRAEEAYMDHCAGQALETCLKHRHPDALVLNIKSLAACHPALGLRVLRKSIAAIKSDLKRVSAAHIRAALDLALSGETGKHLDLPGRIRIYRDRNGLRIQKEALPLRELGRVEKQPKGPA